LTAALDAGTTISAGLNSAYFLGRLFSGDERRPSRLAAIAVLSLWSLAAFVEALAFIALGASAGGLPQADGAAWSAVRALSFFACLGISLLIARKLASE
jgi:hypothetical protein